MTQYTPSPCRIRFRASSDSTCIPTRGVGVGFEARWGAEKRSATPFAKATETKDQKAEREIQHGENWGHFLSYYVNDTDPGTNKTSLAREEINPNRYRISLQDRTFLDEDLYSTINITKLSDARFLQDFEPGEFRENPNPDSMIAVTKWSENYSAIVMARKQINKDFDGTEKLPEGALDIKRQPLWDSPVFYDSETSAGMYQRNFANGSLFSRLQVVPRGYLPSTQPPGHLLRLAFAEPARGRARHVLRE